METLPDKSGYVRQVKVKTQVSTILRPISKICLLLEAENPAKTPEQAPGTVETENQQDLTPDKHDQKADSSNVSNLHRKHKRKHN